MSEWGVIEVVVVLAGLAVTVGGPIVKLIATLVELITELREIRKDFDSVTTRNTESHRRLWRKNEEQDALLRDHDGRIERLEGKVEAYHGE